MTVPTTARRFGARKPRKPPARTYSPEVKAAALAALAAGEDRGAIAARLDVKAGTLSAWASHPPRIAEPGDDPLADRPKGSRFTAEQEAALLAEMADSSLSAVAKRRGLSKSVLVKLRDRAAGGAAEPASAAGAGDAATMPGEAASAAPPQPGAEPGAPAEVPPAEPGAEAQPEAQGEAEGAAVLVEAEAAAARDAAELGVPVHPAAALLPWVEREELAALVADIKAHGVREPVTLDQFGRLLDGRNRYRAAKLAGRLADMPPPERVEVTDAGAVAVVLSKNLRRRHLPATERARIAYRLAVLESGGGFAPVQTRERQAAALNVAPRLVHAVHAVETKGGPEVRAAAEAGAIPLHVAEAIARQPVEAQPAAVAEAVAPKPPKARAPRPPKAAAAPPAPPAEEGPPLPLGLPEAPQPAAAPSRPQPASASPPAPAARSSPPGMDLDTADSLAIFLALDNGDAEAAELHRLDRDGLRMVRALVVLARSGDAARFAERRDVPAVRGRCVEAVRTIAAALGLVVAEAEGDGAAP